MIDLKRGERFNLSKNSLFNFDVKIEWNCGDCEIDSSIFLLSNGKAKDENVVFFNNPNGVNNSVILQNNLNSKIINFDLNKLPNDIDKIVVTLTIDLNYGDAKSFGEISNLNLKISNNSQNISFKLDDFTKETAITLIEIYKKNSEWRLNPVGTGFISGLAQICKDFGIEVNDEPEVVAKPTPPPKKIVLNKITLKKSGDSHKIDLSKKENNNQLLVNLNWTKKANSGGLFNLFKSNTDLDLGCMYILQDGTRGVIQALGNAFGSIDNPPYIALDKDDRSGETKNGENLLFSNLKELKFVVVFAYVYSGIANWTKADGVVTIKQESNPDIIVHLDNANNRKLMCGIISISNENSNIEIKKICKYYKNHKELDKDFGFNFRWVAGSK